MSIRALLKHAAKMSIKYAVFQHDPKDMCCGGTMLRKNCPYHKDPESITDSSEYRDDGSAKSQLIDGMYDPVGDVLILNKKPRLHDTITVRQTPEWQAKTKRRSAVIPNNFPGRVPMAPAHGTITNMNHAGDWVTIHGDGYNMPKHLRIPIIVP